MVGLLSLLGNGSLLQSSDRHGQIQSRSHTGELICNDGTAALSSLQPLSYLRISLSILKGILIRYLFVSLAW